MITACIAAGGLGLLGVLLAVVFIPEPLRCVHDEYEQRSSQFWLANLF